MSHRADLYREALNAEQAKINRIKQLEYELAEAKKDFQIRDEQLTVARRQTRDVEAKLALTEASDRESIAMYRRARDRADVLQDQVDALMKVAAEAQQFAANIAIASRVDSAEWDLHRLAGASLRDKLHVARAALTSFTQRFPDRLGVDHSKHGKGTTQYGPDDSDCGCRGTVRQGACIAAGCGFCSAVYIGLDRSDT